MSRVTGCLRCQAAAGRVLEFRGRHATAAEESGGLGGEQGTRGSTGLPCNRCEGPWGCADLYKTLPVGFFEFSPLLDSNQSVKSREGMDI